MSSIQRPIRTFICGACGYTQDTDPQHFWQQSPEMFPDVPLGSCPACFPRGINNPLVVASDISQMSSIQVSSDLEIESRKTQELDPNGNPIMIQTGERYELRVNQQTGAVYSEAVPVYEPKMREQTQAEINALKEQRDNDLRELEKIAV